MKYLHIANDRNFIEHSQMIFNQYYPEKNIFIIDSDKDKLSVIRNQKFMNILNLSKSSSYHKLKQIIDNENITKIIVHGLSYNISVFIKKIKKEMGHSNVKVYWIFWGYELYQTLGYEKGYKLNDYKFNPFKKISYYTCNPISKMFRKLIRRYSPRYVIESFDYIDYFCFWYKLDYDLLQKYYNTKIKYKYFAYNATDKNENHIDNLLMLDNHKSNKIMINHQASLFGNHDTIFNKLSKIDINNDYEKIVPLSYGSNAIRRHVLRKGKIFSDKFLPILNLLPREEYFSILKDIDVAIFGQLRQEASGNILQLLKNGVKIFLREGNSMLNYYKSKGYIVFSFENDLNTISDLQPLTMDQKLHNQSVYTRNRIYYDDFMPSFFND